MGIQSVDLGLMAPPVAVAVTALVAVLFDLLAPRGWGRFTGWVALAGVVVAGLLLLPQRGETAATLCSPDGGAGACSYLVDDLTLVLQAVLLAAAAGIVLLSVAYVEDTGLPTGEFYFLLLASVTGAVLLPATGDLASLVVALELVSLPSFALVGLRRADGRGAEAALKMFLFSVVAVAVMLYGVALLYAATGTLSFAGIAAALAAGTGDLRPLAVAGSALVLAGFAFKVSAVPFHAWAPDTYAGAPLPVAAYLSTVSKGAGVAGLLVLVSRALWPEPRAWGVVLTALALLSMLLGSVAALRQRAAVRLLAWSGITQAGYLLVPLAALAGVPARDRLLGTAQSATVAYLAGYLAMTVGAFAVVGVVSRRRPRAWLVDFRGLFTESPRMGFALAFFLACLAGLPPGLLGLFVKIGVLSVPVDAGAWWLALSLALASLVSLAYYLGWAAQLFRHPDTDVDAPTRPRAPVTVAAVVWVSLGVTVAASLAPALALGLLSR